MWNKIIEVEPNNKPTWYGGAFTIAFVYSNKGNFIVKGYRKEVKDYLKSLHNKGYKYFVNYTLWSKNWGGQKAHRDIWDFWDEDYSLLSPSKKYSGKGWSKWVFYKYGGTVIKEFKRLPKKWIKEFEV